MKRVLKPGGKFFYMEHIIAQEVTITVVRQTFNLMMLQGRPLRYVQQALMFGGWKIFFCMFDDDLTFGDYKTNSVVNTVMIN